MEFEELNRIHQYRAFGMPEGDRPNAERAAGLAYLERRRIEAKRPTVLGERGDEWGYMSLFIPPLDFQVLVRRNPELQSKDAEILTRAWKKFACSPESLPYRVDAGIGKRKPNTGLIIR